MTKNETKVAVVTGAASGIGRATVTTLLNQEFQVAAIDVDTGGLKSLSSSLQGNEDRCDTYITDVASREQCHSTVSEIFEKNGRIDVFANIAGIARSEHMTEVSESSWEEMIGVKSLRSFLVFSGGNTFSDRKWRFVN